MKPVLSRAQMRAFDRQAIDAHGVPSVVLMENAGRGAANVVERITRERSARPASSLPSSVGVESESARPGRVVVVAGPGNNGGDGFVVARHLALRGLDVSVACLVERSRLAGDAKTQCEAFIGVGGQVAFTATSGRDGNPPRVGSDLGLDPGLAPALERADVVVDAIFGTGLDRAVGEPYASAIEAINRVGRSGRTGDGAACVVALDVPSGLDADTGTPLGAVVAADTTVTFAHYKLGLLSSQAARWTGAIEIVDIGVPASVEASVGHSAALIDRAWARSVLLPRANDVHKHAAGSVLVVAGSVGKVGAALLVARGALRAGAGLVTVATWSDAAPALEARALEEMTARLDATDLERSLDAAFEGKRSIAVGPGLGLGDAPRAVVERVIARAAVPVVLDADGLTLFAGRAAALAAAPAHLVLTPHPGEAARLLGCQTRDVENDRFAAARDLASRTGAVVVLKGARTIIADGRRSASASVSGPAPGSASDRSVEIRINDTGNSVLATAGSGDVLSGVIAAFCTTLEPFVAACLGAHVHGAAGDAWRAQTGADRGMLASEIADHVPAVLGALAR